MRRETLELAAVALASVAAAAAEAAFLDVPAGELALFVILTACAPPATVYFLREYAEEKRVREIEEALPAALFQIASFPKRTEMEKIIRSVARSDYGELSRAFARAERLVNAGASVPEALGELKKAARSPLLDRAVSLLLSAYRSGADMGSAFKEVAEDVFDLQSARRETSSALAMQKYTLLAGGCVLVPVILALVLNIVGSLGFDDTLGIGASVAEREALYETTVWAGQAYLAAFACIASYFVASQEGKPKKAAVYFALLAPASLLLFNFVRGLSLVS